MSGRELVESLLVHRTRLAAFRELVRRGAPGKPERLDSAEVIVCPQGKSKRPIYLVLTNFSRRITTSDHRFSGYPADKPEELFGPPREAPEQPIPPHGKLDKRRDLVIYAFTEDGTLIRPFGGSNMLQHGMIADINGDDLVERVDHTNYGVEGVKEAQVLEAYVVLDKSRPMLLVLYNWGDRCDWDYQFADRDNDGILEIEFGPVVGQGKVKPKAVFRWDRAKKAYVGPEGKAGDHFRVLRLDRAGWTGIGEQLARLKEHGLTFPVDPDATGTSQTGSVGGRASIYRHRRRPAPPPAKPYRYASLKGFSNGQIAAYMGEGRKRYQFEEACIVQTQIPKDFWTSPPREAATAMVDVNRGKRDRQRYRVAIDDRDGKKPPETCSIYYSYRSRRCYVTRDGKYFLRVDPKGSYLAYSCASGLGAVFYSLVEARPLYDLRRVELTYDEARQIAQVVWWLRRVRTWTDNELLCSGSGVSSADGSGALRMTFAQGEEIKAQETVWAGAVSERWDDHFGPEAFVNLVDHLFQVALPQRLGKRWSEQEPVAADVWSLVRVFKPPPTTMPVQRKSLEKLEKRQRRQAVEQVGRLIWLFSDNENQVAYAILQDAVGAAGDFALAELAPRLRMMQKRLPPPGRPVRTRREVERLWDESISRGRVLAPDSDDSPNLFEELRSLEHGVNQEAAREELRRAVALSLRKIDAADDAEMLQQWAESSKEAWQWALQRLRKVDAKRYVAALESWLTKTDGKWTRQVFDAIAEVDPERARELANLLPAELKTDLTVSAFSLLEKAEAIKDPGKRIDALIQVALDPKSGREERCRAIECLVPDDAPLKYPDGRIDEALVKLFDPALADELVNYTLAEACRALALRGRLEHFDKMAQLLPRLDDGSLHNRILASLVRLAQCGRAEHRAKLLRILRPHLKQTNKMISGIILFIYALDLRELKGDLAPIATAGPEDYEGDKAYSYGGRVSPVNERYHLARKVAAIWNEEDTLTRGKLLIAFGFSHGRDSDGVARRTVEKQLHELAGALPARGAREILEFANWYEKHVLGRDEELGPRDRKTRFGDCVRRMFRSKN